MKIITNDYCYINKKDITVCSQNSAGSIFYRDFSGDIIREGIVLYGQKEKIPK